MNTARNTDITPVERAPAFENWFRRLLHNPEKILKPYIRRGMTVLDLGCGPGYFSVAMAKLLEGSGLVIAADLQEGMLDILRQKMNHDSDLKGCIRLQKCSEESIQVKDTVDFVLAFYVLHEVPDQERLLKELRSIMNPGSRMLFVEQKFHVPKNAFNQMVDKIESAGFKIVERPSVSLSRAVCFEAF